MGLFLLADAIGLPAIDTQIPHTGRISPLMIRPDCPPPIYNDFHRDVKYEVTIGCISVPVMISNPSLLISIPYGPAQIGGYSHLRLNPTDSQEFGEPENVSSGKALIDIFGFIIFNFRMCDAGYYCIKSDYQLS